MLFRQLFDRETCTYTYLLADEDAGEAVLIDPVLEQVERDSSLLDELDLALVAVIETHVHADHVTGGGLLRQRTRAAYAICKRGEVPGADLQLCDGDRIAFGRHSLEVRCTPGHTASCASYYLAEEGMIFTGDSLLIRGCGRTDFQEGDAATLYATVHERIFSLPDETHVYPGHDYTGHTSSTVAEERAFNPRLGGGKTVQDFVRIMAGLGLPHPARIAIAVPANLCCGISTVPAEG